MQIIDYIRESKAEFAHISWPTRHQALGFTVLVVVLSILTAVYLGLFDTLLTTLMKKFII